MCDNLFNGTFPDEQEAVQKVVANVEMYSNLIKQVPVLFYFSVYETILGKVSREEVAVLLDFVQMRGGEGPAQIFCPLFTNCILGQFGDGEEGGTAVKPH